MRRIGCHKIANEGTDVDPHVKNIISDIFLWSELFLIINISQQGADIRFKKTISNDHTGQGQHITDPPLWGTDIRKYPSAINEPPKKIERR